MRFENGKTFRQIFRNTEYGVAFNKLVRPSCYNCGFKGTNRWSDITLGDYWGISDKHPLYNDKGVSLLFVNSLKGKELIELSSGFEYDVVDGQHARVCNVSLDRCQAPQDSDLFITRFEKYGLKATWDMKFLGRLFFPESLMKFIKSVRRL